MHAYELVKKLKPKISEPCLFTGGHIVMTGNNQLSPNEGTIKSFHYAAEFYKNYEANHSNVGIGTLINDIGQTCDINQCSTTKQVFERTKFTLPKAYHTILQEFLSFPEYLDIYWEKHMRNRGKKELLKRIKSKNIKLYDEGYYWLSLNKKYLLTRKNSIDIYGTPACPLIMAAYAL
ncbi:MAG: hypothetical protein COT81_05005 [Candidatus Buchananbacteria bacterium CG10_big_fil_rev_8_21_14_0_10_42_9]|uniref:Uncharacterized protein n=1 Tax=Candidatus Buchananbacteria bacterium CG10_big_fil_rev_8_21_14_0_10_42_9 TaxID=1974526 RepID=A0A2H0W021_9BACT|nr:MAG: hypothetical protein COT81_05005 [Candidatus Buchananbacteria bacterium CG10_big_fil_rev_8_21_14_0_10_42_9]